MHRFIFSFGLVLTACEPEIEKEPRARPAPAAVIQNCHPDDRLIRGDGSKWDCNDQGRWVSTNSGDTAHPMNSVDAAPNENIEAGRGVMDIPIESSPASPCRIRNMM